MIAVAIAGEGVATLMQGMAAQQRGKAAKEADYRSADAAERAAAEAVERGKLKETQVVMHGSAVVAEQEVHQSGTGAVVGVGGNAAVKEATRAVSEVDRKVVIHNAQLEAYGLKERARAHRQHGVYAEKEGDAAMVGTFLSGIGRMAAMGGKVGADTVPDAGDSVDIGE